MERVLWRGFPDRERQVVRLADRICALLEEGIGKQGTASLAVSGGSTPVPLFRELAGRELPWEHVVITLVDERWVAPTDPDSNEHLVRTHLLRDRAAAARLVGMKTEHGDAFAGEAACEARLRRVERPFAALVLGMGEDGHTASLFPGAKRLAEAVAMDSGRLCMAIVPPHAPHPRMTLTLPAILDTGVILLHITGDTKREVYARARAEGPPEEMPIRYVLRQRQTPVEVYWAP